MLALPQISKSGACPQLASLALHKNSSTVLVTNSTNLR